MNAGSRDDIEAMLPKMHIEYDPDMSISLLEMSVTVTVEFEDGSAIMGQIDELSGMPGVPLTDEQRWTKFNMCAGRVLSSDDVAALGDLCVRIDEVDDVHAIAELARTRRVAS